MIDAGIGPGSKLPVNTTGGGLRYCHPGMFGIFLLVEAVRQLRGTMRQAPGARRAPRAGPWLRRHRRGQRDGDPREPGMRSMGSDSIDPQRERPALRSEG